jgi:phosphoribosyl 1,2-cyclic phosphodiesterase
MFEVKTLATGSSGNCYLISSGENRFLIEAGIPIKELKTKLQYNLEGIDFALISHSHKDHSHSVKDLLKLGIDVHMAEETALQLAINHHRIKHVEHLKQFKIGEFTIMPFEVNHDVYCLGYLIKNSVGEKLLFITDTYYSKYKFVGVNVLMIEVNYVEEVLMKNIISGRVDRTMRSRLRKSHFSLENVVSFLKANDMSKMQEIHCIHLSNTNSNAEIIKDTITGVTGVPTYIA